MNETIKCAWEKQNVECTMYVRCNSASRTMKSLTGSRFVNEIKKDPFFIITINNSESKNKNKNKNWNKVKITWIGMMNTRRNMGSNH